jgi:hypothetical protein
LRAAKLFANSITKSLRTTKSLYLKSSISITLLDLTLITAGLSIRIYATLDFSKHLLLESTLFDNYSAIYLVNNKERLDKGSFVKLLVELVIKARTFILLITRRGTRTFKGLFNKRDSKRINLVLRDVAVVKGFYINIVSKALFFEKGMWVYKLNSTLCIGTKQENIVLIKLKCIYKVNFLKYKPIFTYLNALSEIFISTYKVLIYLTLKQKIKERY